MESPVLSQDLEGETTGSQMMTKRWRRYEPREMGRCALGGGREQVSQASWKVTSRGL